MTDNTKEVLITLIKLGGACANMRLGHIVNCGFLDSININTNKEDCYLFKFCKNLRINGRGLHYQTERLKYIQQHFSKKELQELMFEELL